MSFIEDYMRERVENLFIELIRQASKFEWDELCIETAYTIKSILDGGLAIERVKDRGD